MKDIKQQRQEALYSFPYHYLALIDSEGIPRITRGLKWGIEYLTYIEVIKQEINAILPACSSLLDVGCGDGYLLNSIDSEIQKHGVDLSTRAIAFAKAFATDAFFEVRDIQDLSAKYDAVTCIEVLEHIPDDALQGFVTQMVKLIKPNGYLIVSVPTTVYKLNKKHYRHYDEALLSAHLEHGQPLELLREKRIYRVSGTLSLLTKALNNRFWTINFSPVLKTFWHWHCKKNIVADQRDGAHLINVYRKC